MKSMNPIFIFFDKLVRIKPKNCVSQCKRECLLQKTASGVKMFGVKFLQLYQFVGSRDLVAQPEFEKKAKQKKYIKVFNVDNVTLKSQIMTSHRKINTTSKKIINYRVTSPSNNFCQIYIIAVAAERPGISVLCCFLFLRHTLMSIFFLPKICLKVSE